MREKRPAHQTALATAFLAVPAIRVNTHKQPTGIHSTLSAQQSSRLKSRVRKADGIGHGWAGGLKIRIKSSDGLEIWPGFQRQSVNLPKLALWQLKLRELSEAIAQIYACRTYGRPSSFQTHAGKVIRPPKFMRGPSSPKRVPTIGRLDPQLVQ